MAPRSRCSGGRTIANGRRGSLSPLARAREGEAESTVIEPCAAPPRQRWVDGPSLVASRAEPACRSTPPILGGDKLRPGMFYCVASNAPSGEEEHRAAVIKIASRMAVLSEMENLAR